MAERQTIELPTINIIHPKKQALRNQMGGGKALTQLRKHTRSSCDRWPCPHTDVRVTSSTPHLRAGARGTPDPRTRRGSSTSESSRCSFQLFFLLPPLGRTFFPATATAQTTASGHGTGIAQPQALSSNLYSHKGKSQPNIQLFRALLGISFVSFTFPVKYFGGKRKNPNHLGRWLSRNSYCSLRTLK